MKISGLQDDTTLPVLIGLLGVADWLVGVAGPVFSRQDSLQGNKLIHKRKQTLQQPLFINLFITILK